MPRTYPSIEDRLALNSRLEGECIVWTRARDKDGYGLISIKNGQRRTHVVSYKLAHGPLPEGKPLVLHTCDNPPCFNPEHLFAGTTQDNIADKRAKGRWFVRWEPQTHCAVCGSAYEESRRADGSQWCKPCDRRRGIEYRARAAAAGTSWAPADNPTWSCACGCGETFPRFDRWGRERYFTSGHNARKRIANA